ncbi:MAG: hypothetical protein Q9219_006791 [cf. Caloplaca sp. 3 TL-2023]
MDDILDEETRNYNRGSIGSGSLLSALVRNSEAAREPQPSSLDSSSANPKGLSRADILGDIYVFSLAGHETTGNALTFAIYLLAAHPEIQSWVQEEIDSLETLRLFPSVIAVPKYTQDEQSLKLNGRVHTIPANTTVILNITAIHTHPKYWGEDSLEWRPSRWLQQKASLSQTADSLTNESSEPALEGEEFLQPEAGTFFPWSDGPRVCPGMRYTKVEFVAVLSTLLQRHRVQPATLAGESEQAAQARVLGRLANCRYGLTLYMADPSSVAMCWIPRRDWPERYRY